MARLSYKSLLETRTILHTPTLCWGDSFENFVVVKPIEGNIIYEHEETYII